MALPRREGLTFPNHPIYPRYRDYYPRERTYANGWTDCMPYEPGRVYRGLGGLPWQNVATCIVDINMAEIDLRIAEWMAKKRAPWQKPHIGGISVAELGRRVAERLAKKQLYAYAWGMSPTEERTNVDSNEKDMIERELPRLRDTQALWVAKLAALRLEEQEQHARVNQAERSLSAVTADITTKEKRLKDITHKFQPGDTVIHVEGFFPGEQKVLEYSSTGNVLVSNPNPNKLPWYCTESNLRKLTPRRFKVGDRVNTGEYHIVTIEAVGYDTKGQPWFSGPCTCGFPALEQLERSSNFTANAPAAKVMPTAGPMIPGTLVERKSVGRKAVITTTDTYKAMTGFRYPLALGQVPVVWLDDGRAGWAWIADLTTG